MTDRSLESVRRAIREGRATNPMPTAEEVRQATRESQPAHEPPAQPPSPAAPSHPSSFDFVGWVGGCIMCSVFMLIPDIWISVWIRAIVVGGSAGFNFKFYFILSGVLGVIIGTIMSARDS